jgi:RNA polymerase sigma-70 factor (ECF subfamily)
MEAVYLHYAPLLSAIIFRGLATQGGRVRLSSPYELGSVVQETFARAFQERARLAYDGMSPYRAYLAAIARNYLLNELRVKEEPSSDAAIELAMGRGVDAAIAFSSAPRGPDELAEEREISRLVEGFLSERTEREQMVFRARFVDRKTQDDSATATGLTRIQVRRIEAHLRGDLLVRLKKSGYLERTTSTSTLFMPRAQGADS